VIRASANNQDPDQRAEYTVLRALFTEVQSTRSTWAVYSTATFPERVSTEYCRCTPDGRMVARIKCMSDARIDDAFTRHFFTYAEAEEDEDLSEAKL
jgi:hypothetical protein